MGQFSKNMFTINYNDYNLLLQKSLLLLQLEKLHANDSSLLTFQKVKNPLIFLPQKRIFKKDFLPKYYLNEIIFSAKFQILWALKFRILQNSFFLFCGLGLPHQNRFIHLMAKGWTHENTENGRSWKNRGIRQYKRW